MSREHTFGLQWRLAVVYLVVAVFGPALTAGGYFAGTSLGLNPYAALAVGLAAGVILGLAGSAAGFFIARSVKLRLWEAGRMAGLIAGGNLQARIPPGPPDEVGWLEEQLNLMAGHLETAVGELRSLAEQNRLLGEEAGRGAALEERARLARDLHDTVNQQLFALAMRLAALRRRMKGKGMETAERELEKLETLARLAHSQTREVIMQLRPVSLERQGLRAALQEYIAGLAAREGWIAGQEIDADLDLPPGARAAENLFRIAQEALNNTARHARACNVGVALTMMEKGIVLRITDDGCGFNPLAGVHPTAVGLSSIRERAVALEGCCRIDSTPGEGTTITVIVPPEAGEGENDDPGFAS